MHARDLYLEDQNHQGTHREHLSQVPAIRVPRLCVGWGTQILLPVACSARAGLMKSERRCMEPEDFYEIIPAAV